jgi:hypothetical protein
VSAIWILSNKKLLVLKTTSRGLSIQDHNRVPTLLSEPIHCWKEHKKIVGHIKFELCEFSEPSYDFLKLFWCLLKNASYSCFWQKHITSMRRFLEGKKFKKSSAQRTRRAIKFCMYIFLCLCSF